MLKTNVYFLLYRGTLAWKSGLCVWLRTLKVPSFCTQKWAQKCLSSSAQAENTAKDSIRHIAARICLISNQNEQFLKHDYFQSVFVTIFSLLKSELSMQLVQVEVQCFVPHCTFCVLCVCVCTHVWSPIKVNYVDIKSSRSTENPLGIGAAALPRETTHAHSIATHNCIVLHWGALCCTVLYCTVLSCTGVYLYWLHCTHNILHLILHYNGEHLYCAQIYCTVHSKRAALRGSEVVARVDHLVIRLQKWDMSIWEFVHLFVYEKTFAFN